MLTRDRIEERMFWRQISFNTSGVDQTDRRYTMDGTMDIGRGCLRHLNKAGYYDKAGGF